MKHYTRNEIYSEIRDPQPQYFLLEGDFWEYVRYYFVATFHAPWYAYVIFIAIIVGVAFLREWLVAVLTIGFFIFLICGAAFYSAYAFHKLVKVGTYVGFNEDGVGYWVPNGQDEDGDEIIKYTVGSPWYELDEINVFDSFIVMRFVGTSKLRLVFIPLNSEEDNNDKLENILAFWKQGAQDKPVGQRDRRLIWIIIAIAMIALKFILKYLKTIN